MTTGRIVWRELVTNDPAASRAFYSELFGWSPAEMDMGTDEPYVTFQHKGIDEDVGGCMKAPMPGIPSHWLDYITVDDVDAALARVEELGGKKVTDPMDIPNVGRFAVIEDSVGAMLSLFRSLTPGASNTERTPRVGTFCWSQLMTRDPDKAIAFYTGLFGWQAEAMGPGMTVFKDAVGTRGSVMQGDAEYSHWLKYVAVDDADASFARASALGAQTYVGPTTMEGMGRFAVLADPTGAVFALWKDLSPKSN